MSKYVVMAGWDDVPHLDEQTKKDLYASIPPYQRDARSKGIPQLGSGAIYPVPESEIVCKPFEIPGYWPRCYALDVGWNRTAAIWVRGIKTMTKSFSMPSIIAHKPNRRSMPPLSALVGPGYRVSLTPPHGVEARSMGRPSRACVRTGPAQG
jgi:hypothetical protein